MSAKPLAESAPLVMIISLDEVEGDDELSWDSDPYRILELKEEREGYNAFGYPIQ